MTLDRPTVVSYEGAFSDERGTPVKQVFDVSWLPARNAKGEANVAQLVTASHDHTWRAWAPLTV
jgi:hypothetical protein